MGLFGRKPNPASDSSQASVADLCRLQQETNNLLRELLVALTGREAITPRLKAPMRPTRQFTDKDVTVVTRQMRIQQEVERQAQTAAPWRTPAAGPDSETISPKGGLVPPE